MKKKKLQQWLSARSDMILSDRTIAAILPFFSGRTIDRQTSHDLLLTEYWRSIDSAITTPGRNSLFAILHAPLETAEKLEERNSFIRLLGGNSRLAEGLEKILWKAKFSAAHSADPVLFDRPEVLFSREKQVLLLLLFVFLVIAVPLLFHQAALFTILGFLVISFLIFARNLSVYNTYIPGLIFLSAHYRAAVKIEALFRSLGVEDPHIRRLSDSLSPLKAILPYLNILRTGSYTSSDPLQMILFWIKNLFCMDLAAYSSAVQVLDRRRQDFNRFYSLYGTVDALLGLSRHFSRAGERYCITEIKPAGGIEMKEVYHPLLSDPVSNSASLSSCVLVTGSNMAGKSTFLRTVGINALLAQTIGRCCAESFSMPLMNIVSVINKQDSMDRGESFYFYEARRISEMLSRDDGSRYLFLIDELLSGTNSMERISASIAIIRHLLKTENIISLIATHDIRIAETLSGSCSCYYFSDRLDETGMKFDYRLVPGIIRTTNAIRMLKQLGLPEEIIKEAEALAAGTAD